MINHTKVPWQVRLSNIVCVGVMEGVEHWQFSGILQCMGPKEVAEANARHIVKCVNYHDRLVEALQDMIGLFPDRPANDGTSGSAWKGSVTQKYDRASSILAELSAHNGGEG